MRVKDFTFLSKMVGASDDIKPSAFAPHDDDDESLNEDDDYEEDDINDDKDIPHLIMCQFDYVKKRKTSGSANSKLGLCKSTKRTFFSQRCLGED
ncbi:hypothetical protein Bca4012_010398 [Brassica carinata]